MGEARARLATGMERMQSPLEPLSPTVFPVSLLVRWLDQG